MKNYKVSENGVMFDLLLICGLASFMWSIGTRSVDITLSMIFAAISVISFALMCISYYRFYIRVVNLEEELATVSSKLDNTVSIQREIVDFLSDDEEEEETSEDDRSTQYYDDISGKTFR